MYEAVDDGGTLTLTVSRQVDAGYRPRRFRRDGGSDGGNELDAAVVLWAADSGIDGGVGRMDGGELADASVEEPRGADLGPVVVLERTPHGFVGEVRALLPHPAGRRCEAHFRAEVLECRDGGLVLASEPATALGEVCQPPARAQPVPVVEQRLLRAP